MIGRTIVSPARRAISRYGIVAFLAFMLVVLVTPAFAAANIVLSPLSVSVTEGGTPQTYTMTLEDVPNPLIEVRAITANSECQVSNAFAGPYGSTADFIITSISPVTVYVLAFDDPIDENTVSCNIANNIIVGDGNYTIGALDFVVGTVFDNDTAGLVITDNPMVLDEGVGNDTFSVALATQPTLAVDVTLSTSDSQTSFPVTLNFTTSNWATPQTVTVTAVDDGVVEGNHTGVINLTTSSLDIFYSGKTGTASANITDNDTATIVFVDAVRNENEPGANPRTTLAQIQYNAGASSLATALAVPIVATPSSGNPATNAADYSQTTLSITFPSNSANNSTQQIDFSVINDIITEPTEQFTFSFGTPTASITNMLTQITSSDTVPVNIIDDDLASAGITITSSGPPYSVAEGSASSANTIVYTITLNTIPNAPVVITLNNVDDDCRISTGGPYLQAPQTVTISPAGPYTAIIRLRAFDDLIVEGLHTCTITHSAVGGGYTGVSIANVVGTVTDNDIPGLVVTSSPVTISEGGGSANFNVRLATQPLADVTVAISTIDGQTTAVSAIGGLVFLTFTPANWNINQGVAVTAVDDGIVEANPHPGSIILDPASGGDSNYNALPNGSGAANITDNDLATVVVTGSPLALDEAVSIGLSYTLNLGVASGITATTDITTDADCRISTTSNTGPWVTSLTGVTLSGSTDTTVFVRAYNDKIVEGAHTCIITHTNTVSATGGANNRPIGNVTGNVADNDSASYQYGAATTSAVENAGTQAIAFSLSFLQNGEDGAETPSLETAISVPVTIGGTATGGGVDYTNYPATLNIDTSGTVTTTSSVTGIVDDRIVEGSETVILTLGAETGGTAAQQAAITLGGQSGHTFTLTDNDILTYRFVAGSGSGSEAITPGTGSVQLVFTTVGSGSQDIASAFTVGYTVGGGTAIGGGVDYTLANGSVSFSPGGPFTQSVNAVIINDSIDEADETVVVTLAANESGTTGSYDAAITADGANQSFTYTILDNDAAGGSSGTGSGVGNGSVSNPYIVNEQGTTTNTFTYTLTSQPTADVITTFTTNGQTEIRVNGSLFAASGTFTFTSGNWNTGVVIVVRAIDDAVYEGGVGTFHAGDITVDFDNASADLIYAGLPNQTLRVNVEDNELPPTIVVTGPVTVTEGGATSSFNVSLSANNASAVTVNISNGPDTNTVTTVTFLSGMGLIPQSVIVTAFNDFFVEGTENTTIGLSASGYTSATVNVTVNDNDTAAFSFSTASNTVAEGAGGSSNVTLTIGGSGSGTAQLGAGYTASGVVANAGSGGSPAINPADYGISGGSIFSFGPGSLSGAISAVTYTTVNDTIDEVNEEFTLSFTTVVGASSSGTHVVTITDDDTAGVTFTGVNTFPALLEDTGNTNAYTVQLTSTPTANVIITIDPDADCEVSINGSAFGTSGTITTNALTVFNVAVRALNDRIVEGNHTCAVSYAISSGDSNYSSITRLDDTYTINDNDTATYQFAGGTSSITEGTGVGTTTANVSVTTTFNTGSGTVAPVGPNALEAAITVPFTINGGSTANGSDYSTGSSIVIPTNGATTNISVSIVRDAIDEANETVIIDLGAEIGGTAAQQVAVTLGSPASHTLTITDDDTAGVTTPGIGTLTATEGGVGSSFTYVLTSEPTANVTVTFTVSDGQSLVNGGTTVTLTFTPANWFTSQTVNVTAVDDLAIEGNHSSTINYSSTSSDLNYVSGSSTTTVAITDNDFAPAITLTGVNTGLVLDEAQTTVNTYTIKLDTVPTGGNTVTIGITAGPDCEININGGAFGTSGSITTNAITPFTIIARALNDFIVEGAHTCAVSYTVGSGDPVYNVMTIPTQNYNVTDNDSATYQFTTISNSVGEAVGTTNVQVSTTFIGNGDASHPTPSFESFVTVPFTLTGTATGGGTDYSVAGSVTIPQSGTTQTAIISINNDGVDEPDETVIFTLGNETTGTPAQQAVVTLGSPSVHTLTIVDDDSTPGINVTGVNTSIVFDEANVSITNSFDIQLNSVPTGSVQMVLTAGPDCEVSVIGATPFGSSVTMTTNSALTVFTVIARPYNDNLLEANHTCALTYKVDSTDTAYDDDITPAIRPATQTYSVLDNELGDYGMVYLPSPLSFTSNSSGGEATTPANTVSVFFAINGSGFGPYGFDLPFSVNYSVTGGTATNGGVDYNLPAGSVTFDPGTAVFFNNVTSILVPFPVVDDAIDEVNETVIITAAINETGTSGSYDTAIFRTLTAAFQSHPYTIVDNDTAGVTVNVGGGVTATEGGSGGSFTVVLTSQPTSDVTITYTITDGQTTTVTSITFTSANWNIPQIVTVTAVNDGLAEGTHTGVISWTSSSSDPFYNATFSSTVNVSITDNDPAVVTIGGGAVNVVEGGATSSYTLTMNAASGVTGTTTVSGGANCLVSNDGIIYSATALITLTGSTASTVYVQAINDTVVEGAHTCTLTHTNINSASLVFNGTVISNVTGNVTDNDTAVISYTAGNPVTEGGSATGTVTLVITANGVPNTGTLGAGVTVAITNTTGTASVTDYNVTTNNVTFAGGSASGATQTVTYTGSVDLFAEGTETFSLGFGTIITSISTGVTASGTQSVNVTDINTATVTNVGGGSLLVNEATETTSDSYTLAMNAQTGVTATTLVTAAADCLVSTDDNTFTTSVTATLSGSTATTIYVRPYDDRIVEGDGQTCLITHGNLVSASPVFSGVSVASVTAIVNDDDFAGFSFQPFAPTTVAENGTSVLVQVNVFFLTDGVGATSTSSLESAISIPVSYAGTASNGVDYTGFATISVSTTPTGDQFLGIPLPITNDTLVEGSETVILTIAEETGGTAAQQTNVFLGALQSHTITITDNDTATITYTAGPDVAEGTSNSGTATLTITANGVSGTGSLGSGVVVAITNTNGTAIGSDYSVVTSSITFASGSATGATQSVTYSGTNDAFAEGTETFSLGFGAVTSTASSQISATGTQSVNVTDTDTVTLTNGAGVINLSEATATTSGSYTLTLNAQPGTSYTTVVTADVDTLVSLDNVNFFPSVIATLTNSTATTIYVRPVDDRSVEGAHTGTITHGPLVFVSGSAIFTGATFTNTTVNITDNDTASIAFTTTSSTVSEGASSAGLTATLTIIATGSGPIELGAAVTVALNATNGTAISSDYLLNTASVTFPVLAGNGATQAFNYSALDDTYAEPSPESFTINFGTITTSISTGVSASITPHTGNITDTDTATITVTDASGSTDISEAVSTPDSYTILLNAQLSDNYLTTITAAADCEVALVVGGPYSASVIATISNSTATTVYVRAINDNIIEGNHTCLIDNGTLIGGSPFSGLSITDVTANVADNDSATISFSALSNTIAEPSTGSVNAVLAYVTNGTGPASLDATLTANVSSSNGTASAGDYGSVTGSVTFNVGALDGAVQTVSYSAVNDAFAEDNETFNVNFGSVTGPVTASILTHVVTITDAGDAVSITVTPNDDDGGPVGNELQVSEAGTTVDTYVITLNIEPGRTATTTISAGVDCLVSTDNVIFTASVSATLGGSTIIYVRAVDDAYAETTPHPCVITHSALVSTVGRFNGQTVSSITADVVDNDIPTVIAVADDDDIAPAGNEIYVSEVTLTQTDTYTITMNAVPGLNATTVVTADVNCLVSTSAGGPFTASVTANLVGSTSTLIYVRAANDEYDEANPHNCGINHANTVSGTAPFNGVAVNSVTGLVEDNDTFGVSVTQSGGTTGVSEAGATDSYTFNLNSVPYTTSVASPVNVPVTSAVTVTFTTDAQCEISYDGITFAQSLVRGFNTTGSVTMTVRAVDDLVIEGPHTCPVSHTLTSADAAYNGLSVPTITVSIIDNDAAAVNISPTTLNVTESGTTGTYTVSLTSQPASNVTINVLGTGVQANASSTTLIFTPSNFSTPQVVTVTAIDDNVAEGPHSTTFTHTITTTAPGYSALGAPSSVLVNITDNDTAGVVVTQTIGNTVVQEGSQTDTYTVVLTSEPTSDVTITIGGLAGEVTVGSLTLTFTSTNWMTPQVVTVTAVNDLIDEAEEETVTLTHTATGGGYTGISVASVPVLVVDNDVAAVVVTPTSVAVTEGGATGTYNVVLATQPTSNVVVTVNGTAQATASAATLTFTSIDWNIAQSVVVTAVNDTVAEGAHVTVFTHSSASSDPKYSGITVSTVQVNITDNDIAGVTVTPTGGNTAVSETGPTIDIYTIGLNTTPTGAVNFTLTADAQCVISTDGGSTYGSSRSFALSNTTPATITVRAVDDAIVESALHPCVITQTVTSTDLNYNGVPVTNVTVQVTDNDVNLPSVVANDDTASTAVSSAVTIPVLTNDTFTGPVTITIVTPPASGSAVPSGLNIIYTNTGGVATTDSFTYRITDGNTTTDTAIVTVSVAGPNSQVNNGGFESGTPIPTGFDLYNRGSSGVVCNQTIARTGNCALILYGSRTAVLAKQVLAVNPVSGQSISLEAWAKWANIRNGGYVQVRVFFTDGTSQIIGANVPTAPLNQTTYVQLTATGTVQAGKTVLRAELWIGYTATAGNVTFDDVAVNYGMIGPRGVEESNTREGAGLLGLPTAPVAPDGFRGNN